VRDRPGDDTTLKARLAGISFEAALVLGSGVLRPCADLRVRQAVSAALSDPALAASDRDEIAGIAVDLAEDQPPGSGRPLTLRFRVSEEEASELRRRAAEAGLTISDYVRRVALGITARTRDSISR